jgi:hypothetical protein
MPPAADIDWSGACARLALSIAYLRERGADLDDGLATAALDYCNARIAEPGLPMPPPRNDPLFKLAITHNVYLDWIILGRATRAPWA